LVNMIKTGIVFSVMNMNFLTQQFINRESREFTHVMMELKHTAIIFIILIKMVIYIKQFMISMGIESPPISLLIVGLFIKKVIYMNALYTRMMMVPNI